MLQKEFPILEFDKDKNALLKPHNGIQSADISNRCVLCFFGEVFDKILDECSHKIVTHFIAGSVKLPIYELEYKCEKIILLQAYVGAPGAAAQIDELTALGCRKFIACGGCGVLQKDIAVGHLIIPTAAVRDEGTSYHYVEPSREITANERVIKTIENTLTEQKVPYIKAKTWTTDAVYRETPAKIQLRKMETAAYIAVAQYNNVDFGQIYYAGDSLAGDEWDDRGWGTRTDLREFVLRLALDTCIAL